MDRIRWVHENIEPLSLAEELLGPPARKTPRHHVWHCPAHDDHTPSLMVNSSGRWVGQFVCFPCDLRGDIIDLYCLVKGCSKREAIHALCPLEDRLPRRKFDPDAVMRTFLKSRQWEPFVAKELGLLVISDSYGNPRIRFPFRKSGDTVYWQDRAVEPAKTKWLSKEGPTPCPYEIDRVKNVQEDWLILVEGLPDVVAIVHDFPDAAVIGLAGAASIKSDWTRFFRRLRVCVFADNDDAGLVMRHKVNEVLGPVALDVWQAWIPKAFNDLDDWRQDDPVSFPYQLMALLDSVSATSTLVVA